MLLRPAVYACRQRGFQVSLLAPLPSAAALLGTGATEVHSVIDWGSALVARLLTDQGQADESLESRIVRSRGLVVFSRQEALIARLARLNPSCVVRDPAPPTGVHAAAWYVRALPASWLTEDKDAPGTHAEADLDDCPPLESSAAEQDEATSVLRQLPERFLAIHPGSGSAPKNWPVESFAALVCSLSNSQPWLLVQGPADRAAAAPLAGLPHCVQAPTLRLRVLATILARAGTFVGNDSGVTHLAAACGASTVALFGPTDPAVWRPLGRNVHVLRSPTSRMEDLDPALVAAAVKGS
jgi:hypothetical protein